MHGFLNLNKPAGATSRQVVNRIQRLTGIARVGHAGTLDPLATGVLVVGVGAATRLIEYVQRMTKSYRGTFLLGRSSPTEDLEGEVTLLQDPRVPTLDEVTAAAGQFVGRIRQRPPAYSALKVQGRPAYRLARQGRPVELAAREVTIHRLAVAAYEYPELVLEVECSGGTYIRSLGRDLAESLGTAAVMSALVRTAVGGFTIAEAADPRGLTAESCAARLEPLLRAVEMLPKIVLSAEEAVRIGHGLTIRAGATGFASARPDTALAEPVAPAPALAEPVAHPEMAAVDQSGRLVAIVGPAGEGLLRPLRNLPP
jgi:tRNA pseudouridine55 synthase